MTKKLQKVFLEFCDTIAQLRHPKTGCPWDLQQTHVSLRRYMLEEAYEATDAMTGKDYDKICEELGDVLLQVVLNAQIACDNKKFTLSDVIESINAKMRRRHPHVFERQKNRHIDSAEKVKSQWRLIKAAEKSKEQKSYFAKAQTLKNFPASIQAVAIGKAAETINFDWPGAKEVFAKFSSEVMELQEALEKRKFKAGKEVEAELGDVFFSLAQLSRHLGYDPEVVAFGGNKKFLDRFAKVEKLAKAQGLKIEEASAVELEKLWVKAKG